MFTCNLTKLETAVEQVRKAYPKLRPTDVALLASALVLTGRHAQASYEGEQYAWPDDYDKLTQALAKQIEMVHGATESKKSTKSSPEDEPMLLAVGLVPNYSAGEARLGERNDLKALLSDVLAEGVEFVYSATDVGWQWALDRANWSTISGLEITRKIKVKATFSEGAVGIEMGATARRRASKKPAKTESEPEPAGVE